jgi:eukaryotic-like serine/threonine-protein kinase
MGEVYDARAPDMPRRLAVKRVLEADASRQDLQLLFLREVAVAATLEHHHVVEMIDAGSCDRDLFLVMEHVDGPSLAEILDVLYRDGRLIPVELACGIVSQVAVGLAHAHERALPDGTPLGIIHRDVAAENILIGRDGVPKLLDFGLAKILGHSLTEPGVVRGRPRSLSPEQARGDEIDARSDLFALGAILFELVSGEQLYPDEGVGSLLFKVASGNYESVASRVPEGTDPDLVRIIARAVAKDPEDRYPSARQMERELAAFRAARGMRLSSRELADLVDSVFPRVLAQRQKSSGGKPGELEGRTIHLSPDRESQSGPHVPATEVRPRPAAAGIPVRTPRSARAQAFDPVPANEAPDASEAGLPASGAPAAAEAGLPASGGPAAAEAGFEPPVAEAADRTGDLSDDLASPVGSFGGSDFPRPARPGRFAEGEPNRRWTWYAAAVMLAAASTFVGVWLLR